MKKLSVSVVLAALLLSASPMSAKGRASIADRLRPATRVIKCAIPSLHKKFNCTDKEKKDGKKWLRRTSIAAAMAALAGVVGGVSLAKIKQAKKAAGSQVVTLPYTH